MARTNWVTRWSDTIAAEPALRGVWRRKAGGYRVRRRVRDPRTGGLREINRALPQAPTARAALMQLDKLCSDVINEVATSSRIKFHEAVAETVERRCLSPLLTRPASRRVWTRVGESLIEQFGALYFDMVTLRDLQSYRDGLARRIAAGDFSADTANSYLRVLRAVTRETAELFELPDPGRGLKLFPTKGSRRYTAEEPNSVPVDRLHEFLMAIRESNPQVCTLATLGFATGLRPSSIRPLRKSGPCPDYLPTERMLLIRRSHTVPDGISDRTKTGVDITLWLPQSLCDVLDEHISSLRGHQAAGDLLFSKPDGSVVCREQLVRAFRRAAKEIGIKHKVTPRAMRRTFQDLARLNRTDPFTVRAISGHSSEQMRMLYSTPNSKEVSKTIDRVLQVGLQADAHTHLLHH